MPIEILPDDVVYLTVPMEPHLKTAASDTRAWNRWEKAGIGGDQRNIMLRERWRKREEKSILASPEIKFLKASKLAFSIEELLGTEIPDHYVRFLYMDAKALMLLKLAFG